MPDEPKRPTTEEIVAAISDGLAKVGLGDYKISALHLRPKKFRSVGAAAADDGTAGCQSQELPNGHFILVCE